MNATQPIPSLDVLADHATVILQQVRKLHERAAVALPEGYPRNSVVGYCYAVEQLMSMTWATFTNAHEAQKAAAEAIAEVTR